KSRIARETITSHFHFLWTGKKQPRKRFKVLVPALRTCLLKMVILDDALVLSVMIKWESEL
ncbi:MAG: hypothetical protein V7740_15205, partial [Pseudomonas marincola]